MKHRVFGKKLGRNFNERKSLLKAQVKSLFTYGSIQTTEAKAKATVRLIENLCSMIITKSDLMARRELFKILQDQTFVNNVFATIRSTFINQSSNFTKMERIKRRQGDDSIIVKLGFVKPVSFVKKAEKIEEKKEVKELKKVAKKVIKKTKEVKPKVKKETK